MASPETVLSSETGTVLKREALTEVALVFPNSYGVGMSNLGFQSIYSLINARGDALCHRAFHDGGGGLLTVEAGRRLSEYDIVAFSISFENDYLNVVRSLSRSGIRLLGSERGDREPLVIAGGAAVSLNPEPLAPFVDAFVVGEGDELAGELLNLYGAERRTSRSGLLRSLSSIDGVYVPSLYGYEPGSGFSPRGRAPFPVRARRSSLFPDRGTRSAILSRRAGFSNMFMVEVSRGCSRGCLFCPCGAVYGRARHREPGAVLEDVRAGLESTKKIGLVGAAVSDYPGIDRLVGLSCDMGARVSLSSLRADSLTRGLLSALRRSGQRTITLAPEAGSYRLRARIGKPIADDDVFSALEEAARLGFGSARLYFMIGLPGEETEDVEAIVRFLKRASGILPVRASVNSFVPKAWTPFAWTAMEPKEKLRAKGGVIQKGVSGEKRVTVVLESVRSSIVEGALARGDRSLGLRLAEGKAGEKLLQSYAGRALTIEDPAPWEIIDPGRGREELWSIWQSYSDGLSRS